MEEPLLVLMGEKKWEETHQYTFQLLYVPKKKNLLNFYLSFFFMVVSLKQQAWATDDVAQIYDKCITELEQHLHAIPPTLAMNPQAQALRSLLEVVVLSRNSRDAIAALGLLQKVGS